MVKRLMTHYTMYAKSNTTDVDKEVTKNWEEFLHNNTDFIHPFDFVKVGYYINKRIYPIFVEKKFNFDYIFILYPNRIWQWKILGIVLLFQQDMEQTTSLEKTPLTFCHFLVLI